MNKRPHSEASSTRPSRPTASPRPPTRMHAGQAPATPLDVSTARAIDQDLSWYFAFAESALRRENVGLLPAYAAATLSPTDTDDTVRWRATGLARAVRDCLAAVSARHASVLRATYTPRRWPRRVEQRFQALVPVVVRLALAEDPWPSRSSRSGLERSVAVRLSRALARLKPPSMARLESRARRLFGSAIAAYAVARGRTRPGRHSQGA
jgi:hypothetical protein